MLVLALVGGVQGPTRIARAQEKANEVSDPATRSAREHFAEGVKLYDAKPPDFEGALSQFRDAYEAKPSAGIKRNIALCLKALHRYAEAMDALDEVVTEGAETLRADVKAGVRKTLAELDPLVASLKITVRLHASDPSLRPPFELFIDEAPVLPERLTATPVDDAGVAGQRLDRSIRVLPGVHTIRGRALGFQEATQAVTALAGSHDAPVAIDLLATALAGLGKLTVRVDPRTANIAVDGVVLARGAWSGEVGVGTHLVTASAEGFAPFATKVTTVARDAQVVPIHLVVEPTPGPGALEQAPPAKKPPRLRNNYASLGMTVQTEALTPTSGGFGDTTNTKRSFGGLTFTARYGRKLARGFALELFGEAGGMTTTYAGNRITITNLVLAPEVTFHTGGVVRFLGGAAAGIEGQLTDASVAPTAPSGASNAEISGHGIGPMGLIEGGVEGGPWPVFFQATVFAELHGTSARDGAGNPLYGESSTARGGLRLVVGCEL